MGKVDIYFQSEQEVIHFCEYLFQQKKEINVTWRLHKKWGNQISLGTGRLEEEQLLVIADCLIYAFYTVQMGKWTREIIKEHYYYSDKHEIESIHHLFEWVVMSGPIEGVVPRRRENPLELLEAIFIKALQSEQAIYFDAMVQFGMKLYKEALIDYVGLAIDEFKREEEHQSFIHSLREYVQRKEPNNASIHVLEANPFKYFDKLGMPIPQAKLDYWLKKEPLYLFGLPTDEQNLAPLIALIPETIHLYTIDASAPKIQTIMNVFEEKVLLHAITDFPFRHEFLRKGNYK